VLSGAPENALAVSESTLLSSRGPGNIWNYLGAPVRSAEVFGRFACGFWTDLHFADVAWANYLTMTFAKGLLCWFWLPPAYNMSSNRKTQLHSDTLWYDRNYVLWHIIEIGVFWVLPLLLAPLVGYVLYPKCTANHHWVVVVIIEIWINWPPGLWCFKWWIQIKAGGSHWVCFAIASSGCRFGHIVRR